MATTPSSVSTSGVMVTMAGRTHQGLVRQDNQDAYACVLLDDPSGVSPDPSPLPLGLRGALLMVADGMGGGQDGAVASAMAVDIVLSAMRAMAAEPEPPPPAGFATALRQALEQANTAIHELTQDGQDRAMGTTATVVGVIGTQAFVGQIGDSRAYLVRDAQARQITKDQSLVQHLVDSGAMTAEEAVVSNRRHVITQALGPLAAIAVDLTSQQLRRGDALVVCSDGLSGLLTSEDIAGEVATHAPVDTACDHLVTLALERGAPDNVTVVVARFDGDGLEEAREGDVVGHLPIELAQ